MSEKLKTNNLNEANKFILPEPHGSKSMREPFNYKRKYQKVYEDIISKAKRDAMAVLIEDMKKELIDTIIAVTDDNGRQKIFDRVSDIIVEQVGGDFFPFFIERNDGKERRVKYEWNNDNKNNIYRIDRFLDFFEEHYLGKLIAFQGKQLKGSEITRCVSKIIRIGIHIGTNVDNILTEDEEGKQRIMLYNQPIQLLKEELKKIDPFAEEDWDN